MSSERGEIVTTPKVRSFFAGRRSLPACRSHPTPTRKSPLSPRSRERNLAHQMAKSYRELDPIFERILEATKKAHSLKFRHGLEPRFPDKAISTMKRLARQRLSLRSNPTDPVDQVEIDELHLVISEYEADIARAETVEVMVDEELHPKRKRKLPAVEWKLKTPESDAKERRIDDTDKVTDFLFHETLAKARAAQVDL